MTDGSHGVGNKTIIKLCSSNDFNSSLKTLRDKIFIVMMSFKGSFKFLYQGLSEPGPDHKSVVGDSFRYVSIIRKGHPFQ